MSISKIQLENFRCIQSFSFEPDLEGINLITGFNGTGKTSILEGIYYLANLQSFRMASRDMLVRRGSDSAVLRSTTIEGSRSLSVEAEISLTNRHRTLLNGNLVRSRDELSEALRTTIFSPTDVDIVRGGPGSRRRFLDQAVSLIYPRSTQYVEMTEKILKHRTALLRQMAGRGDHSEEHTLEIWDARLHENGTALAESRELALKKIEPKVSEYVKRLAGKEVEISLRYCRSWEGELGQALKERRKEDRASKTTNVGPHRDEMELTISDFPARTQTSQGEQRTLALALRLAVHDAASIKTPHPPVLLLDDVFSELDELRSQSLMSSLPSGQKIITSSTSIPGIAELGTTLELRRQ